jgi:hypothetical protein
MTAMAQITGVAVTSIIVLGNDFEIMFALPAGLLAGALAMLFARTAERTLRPRKK